MIPTHRLFAIALVACAALLGCAHGPSAPQPEARFTIAVIPDTQNYVKYGKNQANFHIMTEWLRTHAESCRIQTDLHEGDFVEQNDVAVLVSTGDRFVLHPDPTSIRRPESVRGVLPHIRGTVPPGSFYF